MLKFSVNSLSYSVNTPEGVNINLPLAGLWSRASAWLIDLMIRAAIYLFLAIILSLTGLFGQGVLLIIVFILEWFYPVFYEVLNQGKTPGKNIIGIRVINTNGSQLDWGASMTRNILRFVDMLPLVYGVGLISVLMSAHSQRVGDIVARTIVIYENKENIDTLIMHEDFTHAKSLSSKSLINDLKRDERTAFIAFAERFDSLSSSRKEELISIIYPVLRKYNIENDLQTIKDFSLQVVNS